MAQRKNLKDGYQQAIRETGTKEETRIAVTTDGVTTPVFVESLFDSTINLETGTSLSADFNTSAVDCEEYSKLLIKAIWTGAQADNEATMVVEVSDNGTDWSQIGESGMALIVEADTQIWQVIDIPSRYLRVAYTDNGNATGTINIDVMGRR